MSSIVKDIEEKGFFKFSEPDALSLIRINDFKLLNVEERSRDNGVKDIPLELTNRLNTFAYYLKEKYIDANWHNSRYNKFIVWDGVDKDNQGWHTDMFEGYDLFFLYYFDNTYLETGGAVQFKYGDCEESFQPIAGDLFLVNNGKNFWHKATQSSIQRRVASFDFNIL